MKFITRCKKAWEKFNTAREEVHGLILEAVNHAAQNNADYATHIIETAAELVGKRTADGVRRYMIRGLPIRWNDSKGRFLMDKEKADKANWEEIIVWFNANPWWQFQQGEKAAQVYSPLKDTISMYRTMVKRAYKAQINGQKVIAKMLANQAMDIGTIVQYLMDSEGSDKPFPVVTEKDRDRELILKPTEEGIHVQEVKQSEAA